MKSRKPLLYTILMISLLVAAGALAQDISRHPGYVDLEWIPIPSHADEVQDIDLSTMLIGLAADAEETGDEELVLALSMVKSIRVKAYSIEDEDTYEAERAVDRVAATLKKNDWKRLIYMKDDEETVTVSTKYDDGDLVGLMVVLYKPGDEVAFVNVAGDLDLATLFKLAQHFDTDDLEEILNEVEDEGIRVRRHGD